MCESKLCSRNSRLIVYSICRPSLGLVPEDHIVLGQQRRLVRVAYLRILVEFTCSLWAAGSLLFWSIITLFRSMLYTLLVIPSDEIFIYSRNYYSRVWSFMRCILFCGAPFTDVGALGTAWAAIRWSVMSNKAVKYYYHKVWLYTQHQQINRLEHWCVRYIYTILQFFLIKQTNVCCTKWVRVCIILWH